MDAERLIYKFNCWHLCDFGIYATIYIHLHILNFTGKNFPQLYVTSHWLQVFFFYFYFFLIIHVNTTETIAWLLFPGRFNTGKNYVTYRFIGNLKKGKKNNNFDFEKSEIKIVGYCQLGLLWLAGKKNSYFSLTKMGEMKTEITSPYSDTVMSHFHSLLPSSHRLTT